MDSSIMTYLLMALALVGVFALVALINTLAKVAEFASAAKKAAESATETSNQARELISTEARELILESKEVVMATREMVAEIRAQIHPTLEKVDIAVDGVNLNLLRLDSILESFEHTSEQVAGVSNSVSNLVNGPMDAIGNISDRIRRSWKARKAELADELSRHPLVHDDADRDKR